MKYLTVFLYACMLVLSTGCATRLESRNPPVDSRAPEDERKFATLVNTYVADKADLEKRILAETNPIRAQKMPELRVALWQRFWSDFYKLIGGEMAFHNWVGAADIQPPSSPDAIVMIHFHPDGTPSGAVFFETGCALGTQKCTGPLLSSPFGQHLGDVDFTRKVIVSGRLFKNVGDSREVTGKFATSAGPYYDLDHVPVLTEFLAITN